MSCDIDNNAVIEAGDAQSIYQVPMNFLKEGILMPLCEQKRFHTLFKKVKAEV